MKKVLSLFLVMSILLVINSPVYADDMSISQDARIYLDTNDLIEDGLEKNITKITELSSKLSPNQRLLLFKSFEKDPVGPSVLNSLVGFGSGSFMAGDLFSGFIQLGGDIAATIFALWTFVMVGVSVGLPGGDSRIMMLVLSGLALVAPRVYGGVISHIYAKNYNATLRKAIFGTSAVSLKPYHIQKETPTNQNLSEVGMTLKYQF